VFVFHVSQFLVLRSRGYGSSSSVFVQLANRGWVAPDPGLTVAPDPVETGPTVADQGCNFQTIKGERCGKTPTTPIAVEWTDNRLPRGASGVAMQLSYAHTCEEHKPVQG